MILVEGQRTAQPLIREALEAKRDHHEARAQAWGLLGGAAKDTKILSSVSIAIILFAAGIVYWAFGLAPKDVTTLVTGPGIHIESE